MKRAALILVAAGLGAAGVFYYSRGGIEAVEVNASPVTRGPIVDTVGATGTLQAVTTVQVGSQVSGSIQSLGADFNSIVKKGQVIARLDPSLIEAQVQQARANLAQAQANLTKAQSDLDRARVQLVDAQQKYTRAAELAAKNLLPLSDLDAAKTAVDTAQASLASQQATVTQVQASVNQSQASLSQARVNLEHTVITAPIDGIVTQRSVDVGQTVAASLQSPTLFVIAADLTKMQVYASIDEADVGRIRPNQHASFRVDAYPTEEFTGTVVQVRLQPVVVQNVTTYGTVIDVPNPQLKLKPGMTATVKIEVARRDDALRVPNTALRFRPTDEMFAALDQPVPADAAVAGTRAAREAAAPETPPPTAIEQKPAIARMKERGGIGQPRAATPQPAETIDALFGPLPVVESQGRAWLYVDERLQAVRLRLGLTDGTNTEVLGGDLQEGSEVVTGIVIGGTRSSTTTAQPASGAVNPLLPQRGGPPGAGGRGGP
jgi:HlyD family secretion protein